MSTSKWYIATAFTPSIIQSRSQQQQHSTLAAPPKATIYYPDGSTDSDYEDAAASTGDYDIFGYNSATAPSMPLFGQLATQLSSDSAITSTLARLASAFSPPGFTFDIANVNDVRCSSLDNRHLEIEAVVCDDLECSSLLVPVTFPEECSVDGDGLQDCVLRNMRHLDVTGENVLQEREQVFAEDQEAQLAMGVLQSLGSDYLKSDESGSCLPSWWEPPHSNEDKDECNLIQQLLNGDDFQDMTRGLATYSMLHNNGLGEKVIRTVRVKAVGPEGMVLKVQLSLGGRTYADVGGVNNEAVMNVPIKFSEMSAGYDDGHYSIREKVLRIVSSVDTVTV